MESLVFPVHGLMKKNIEIALVVGGSRGIGRSIALTLAEDGFDILLTYNSSHSEADKVKERIESMGRSCQLFCFDVSNLSQTKNALEKTVNEKAPYAVIFNSGIAKDNLMVWMSQKEWEDVISVNLNGFYNVMNTVLFSMLQKKKGRIIAVSSVSGETGNAGQVNYSASKAGLIGAVKSLAREVGKRNILVNAVAPGIIDTEMIHDLPKDKILANIPLNRFGTEQEVASVVSFLCSDGASYIHGQVIGINGGLCI